MVGRLRRDVQEPQAGLEGGVAEDVLGASWRAAGLAARNLFLVLPLYFFFFVGFLFFALANC